MAFTTEEKLMMANVNAVERTRVAIAAAKVMAKDFDRRRKIAQKALRGIDTYAWSMVKVRGEPGRKELQKRINACRKALAEI